MKNDGSLATGYNSTYSLFVSSLMKRVRAEAYDEDFGQHSWITGEEIRTYLNWLDLNQDDLLLDFGCGPGGPLTYLIAKTGAKGIGIDLSEEALEVAQIKAEELEIEDNIEFQQVNGNSPFPFSDNQFEASISVDVILHLQDRQTALKELHRVTKSGGKVVVSDAGIITGAISDKEIKERSINGFTQFVPESYNLEILKSIGFKIIDIVDNSRGPISNATGRYKTRKKYRNELITVEGEDRFRSTQRYLHTVADLYQRRALSRYTYLLVRP